MINEDFGPHNYGCELLINSPSLIIGPGPVAFDVETDEKDSLVGIAVCSDPRQVFYYTSITEPLKEMLESKQLIAQGGAFDIGIVRKCGVNISLDQITYDTRIMCYVIDSGRKKYGLKPMAKDFLNMEWPTYKEMVKEGTLDTQPVERAARYCGNDALATYKLYKLFSSKITTEQTKYLNEIEMPCSIVVAKMIEKGIEIDVNYLQELDLQFKLEEEKLEKEFNQYVPPQLFDHKKKKYVMFNPRSPKQVLRLLIHNGLKVKSTGSEILEKFTKYPVVNLLLQYREINKLRSTYVTALLKRGVTRVHSFFNQTGTITGRFSSSKPNVQNIPIRTDKGALIRNVFCAKDNYILIGFDYAQVEYRLFAHSTQDETLIKIVLDGGDVHANTASAMFNVSLDEVTKDLRRKAKTINFGIIYGQSTYGLAQQLGISEDEATQLMDQYWRKMPRAASWINVQKWKAHKNKSVETLCGRSIKLPFIDKDIALTEAITNKHKYYVKYKKNLRPDFIAKLLVEGDERRATNFPFQGGSADITKKAMIEVYKAGYTPILQCHDELLFEVPNTKEEIDNCIHTVKPLMENVVKLSIPLVVDHGVGKTWGGCK